jgi:hypothetical protein
MLLGIDLFLPTTSTISLQIVFSTPSMATILFFELTPFLIRFLEQNQPDPGLASSGEPIQGPAPGTQTSLP